MNAEDYFHYKPNDNELERASNSYLMSVIVVMCGLPLPVVNLIGCIIFFLGNRKNTYFVRWHCTQALLLQLLLFPINSVGFWWTIHIIFFDSKFTSHYFAYILAIILFNLFEFIITIYAAVQVRKGIHVKWWFYGDLANILCKA